MSYHVIWQGSEWYIQSSELHVKIGNPLIFIGTLSKVQIVYNNWCLVWTFTEPFIFLASISFQLIIIGWSFVMYKSSDGIFSFIKFFGINIKSCEGPVTTL